MTEIILSILFSILVVFLICCAILLIVLSLVNKSLLCAKIYYFFFEHDDWLLYERAKKQGIQHYLNVHHLKQFGKKWKELKVEYGIINDDFSNIDESTSNLIISKFDELSNNYHYKEYHNVAENIKSDDIVLVGELFGEKLTIQIGYDSTTSRRALYNQPMVRDILKGCEIWANGKTDNIKRLLVNPKDVISF